MSTKGPKNEHEIIRCFLERLSTLKPENIQYFLKNEHLIDNFVTDNGKNHKSTPSAPARNDDDDLEAMNQAKTVIPYKPLKK